MGRYAWFAPDTSDGLFSWIGPTASLLSGSSLTSLGAVYNGNANAAINAINAHTEGRAFNTTGMAQAEARAPHLWLPQTQNSRGRLLLTLIHRVA